jgi:iron complex outermembrane recepter protein
MRFPPPFAAVLSASLLLLPCTHTSAQNTPAGGRLSGVLHDRTGAVVRGGTVEARAGSAEVLTAASDAEGRYALEPLRPGRYEVAATAAGFDRSVREVDVSAGAEAVADFTLDVARHLLQVEVTAPAGRRPLEVETDPRTPRQPIPAHDGADYLKTIPGFSVIRKGGADGDPVLRGMAGSRLGVLLDGEIVLGGCGNRMDPPTAYAYPEAYDRITVLKGPQTVLHGPGNSAGVVLFERDWQRYSRPDLNAFASATFGSFGRNDQIADVKGGAGHAYARLSATRSAMDDYQDGSGQAIHSRYERWSANGAFGWTPGEATRVEVSGALSDGEAAYADRTMDGVRFFRENVGLRLERRNISRVFQNLEGQAYYNYVDHVMDNYSLRAFTPSTMMPYPSVSNPDRRTVGGRLSGTLQFAAATLATIGADYQDNRHSIRKSVNQPADPFEAKPRVSDAAFDNFGVYGELTQGLGTKGRIVAGGRVDAWTGRDERTAVAIGAAGATAPNPTAGMRREETLASGFARYETEFGPALTFYAGVGRADRAPDYWELISKESATSVSAFETLPEKTTQLDSGVLYRKGAVSGSAAIFVNGVSDFILIQSNVTKTAMGGMAQRKATITRNIDASAWGGEATLKWEATRRLALDTSLAFVRGRNETDGLPLAQQPPLEARLGLTYSADRWAIGCLGRLVAAQTRYALYQGNIVGQDLGPAPSFGVLSLNGRWRVAGFAYVSAGADNVFDTVYAEFISRTGAAVPGFVTTTRVNEPGRTLWVKLDLRH